MNQQNKSFMDQFSAAKKEAQNLRVMMKDSARVATLTFPQSKSHSLATADASKKKS